VAALALLAFTVPDRGVDAAESGLSNAALACLKCHDSPDITDKKLDDGKTLRLRISTEEYLAAVHNEEDCTDCHSGVDVPSHGKVTTPLKNRRELTKSMQESCRDCHKKKYRQYDDSIHAALVRDGSEKAPLCADCHNAHTQRLVKIVAPIEQTPCAACHEEIFKAYAQDVHGQQRVVKGKAAPICADCHQAHEVKAASLGEGPKGACLGCHKNAIEHHEQWLPNAALHFETISCPACHAPTAQRRVNLRLYDAATKTQLREKEGVPQFQQRARAGDAVSEGLDERALWSLLAQFNQDSSQPGHVILRGRLEVRSGIEAHQLSDKSRALRDCDSCHSEGAEPFQSVVISIAGPDGRPLRHGVQKEVLNSLTALQSVRGFYAIGSTRIKLLDILLVLVVGGSLAGSLAHMTIKRLFRGVRERRRAAAAANDASRDGGST
jgi:hypothetical protein